MRKLLNDGQQFTQQDEIRQALKVWDKSKIENAAPTKSAVITVEEKTSQLGNVEKGPLSSTSKPMRYQIDDTVCITCETNDVVNITWTNRFAISNERLTKINTFVTKSQITKVKTITKESKDERGREKKDNKKILFFIFFFFCLYNFVCVDGDGDRNEETKTIVTNFKNTLPEKKKGVDLTDEEWISLMSIAYHYGSDPFGASLDENRKKAVASMYLSKCEVSKQSTKYAIGESINDLASMMNVPPLFALLSVWSYIDGKCKDATIAQTKKEMEKFFNYILTVSVDEAIEYGIQPKLIQCAKKVNLYFIQI
ncbi:hypothetical protein RFI_08964 [Reticulomyxa filosa]|uniref:Uncharacterized protein n=1 Tax=Reticulomyxa filosa TaxID=46433 RepID=X6NQH4_RETFI|nr:hypothetical protein RFI_08964 [Reticulomyxa filosa]|eukprot:ETO28168.1 hypothetical protein RFI_08964 [Reticulomyxa filosa]